MAGCSRSAPKPGSESFGLTPEVSEDKRIASTDVVMIAMQPTEVVAGGQGNVVAKLTIKDGYHVNANPATYPYLIATMLSLEPADGISAGEVSYPKPLTRKFAFAETPLAVYEGESEIKVPVKAAASATKGERAIPARLKIQACDEQVCYPPGTIDLKIPLVIK